MDPYVARTTDDFPAEFAYLFCGGIQFLGCTTHNTEIGTKGGEVFGNAQVDAATAAGDEYDFIFVEVIGEDFGDQH